MLLRLKEDYDGAEPAAQSDTVQNLLMLGHLVSAPELIARARCTLERYGNQIGKVVRVMPFMVANLVLWHMPPTQVVIVGTPGAEDTLALERVLCGHYLPSTAVVLRRGEGDDGALAKRLPWLGAMTPRDGRAAAYVCRDFACQAPESDPQAFARQLDDIAAPRRIIV